MDADLEYERVALSVADQFELQGVLGDIPLPNSTEEWDLVLTMLGGRGAEAMRGGSDWFAFSRRCCGGMASRARTAPWAGIRTLA
jgi:hypothetical protein